ncbi:hypothetical protein VM1G_00529 [Cytospora mali]|uniref:PI-PLC X domain-containing protein 1 n=1 Tax=Cytospora mali TaxID=578113 RepID=A0A194VND2_CYTMA|nr:hypothetical protein VM1G_00529 [Valsa mali]
MMPSILSSLAVALSLTATVQSLPGPQGGGGGWGGDSGSWGGASTTSTEESWAATTSANNAYYTSLASSATSSASASTSTSTVACNNSPDLCSRKYSNVTHMGAHDAAFLRNAETSNSVAGNQYYNATKALNSGIRLLSAQVHNLNGTLELCHSTCSLLDAGTLESWLSKIKDWMDENPNEVVTLLLVNSDDEDVSTIGEAFVSSNISTYGYAPATASASNDWPTLQTMIDANTRLVTFVAAIEASDTYPYLLDEWTYVFETAYDVTALAGFNCSLNRPTTLSSASTAISSGYLPLMNHFVYQTLTSTIEVPSVSIIDTTNSPGKSTTGMLGQSAYSCLSEWATAPVFVLVDFYDQGPAIETADNLNGITAVGRSNSTAATSAASSAGGTEGVKAGALVAFVAAAVLFY